MPPVRVAPAKSAIRVQPQIEYTIDIDAFWYWSAFAFGIFILFAFAYRKFNELLGDIPINLAAVLAKYSSAALTSRGSFRKGFVVYFSVYVLIYFAVCRVPDIRGFVFQEVDASDSGGWIKTPAAPLLVLSVLVGLIPNVPFIDETERFLRRIGHRIARIPDNLLERSIEVGKAELLAVHKNPLSHDKEFQEKIRKCKIITEILDLSVDTRTALVKYLTKIEILSPNVHGLNAKNIWAPKVLVRFDAAAKEIASSAEQCRSSLKILLNDWNRLALDKLNNELTSFGFRGNFETLDAGALQSTQVKSAIDQFARNNSDLISDIAERWSLFFKRCEDASQLEEGLTALLYINDRSPDLRNATPEFASILKALSPPSQFAAITITLFASFVAFVACGAALGIFRIAKSTLRNDGIEPLTLISIAFRLGWVNATYFFFLFSIPVAIAILIRYFRIRGSRRPWSPIGRPAGGAPLTQMLIVAAWSFFGAAALQAAFFTATQLEFLVPFGVDPPTVTNPGGPPVSNDFKVFISTELVPNLAICVIGMFVAIVVCYILDRQEVSPLTRFQAVRLTVLIGLASIVGWSLIRPGLDPDYFELPKYPPSDVTTYRYDQWVFDLFGLLSYVLAFIGVLTYHFRFLPKTEPKTPENL